MNDIHLKIKFLSLSAEARLIKNEERKQLRRGRRLFGRYSKRHSEGQEKPEAPAPVEIADRELVGSQCYEEFWGLQRHRIQKVRKEARKVHLIRNYLKGRDYADIERTTHEQPNWNDVVRDLCRVREADRANDPNHELLKQDFMNWAGLDLQDGKFLKI